MKPVAIDASIDSKELQDGEVAHIEINIVDENGIEVPMANMELNFTVTGGGKLIGLENGANCVQLDVRETQDAAIQLFNSKGYKKWGTNPNYAQVDGKNIKGFYYLKKLK